MDHVLWRVGETVQAAIKCAPLNHIVTFWLHHMLPFWQQQKKKLIHEYFVLFQEIKNKILGWLFKIRSRSMTRASVCHLEYELHLMQKGV
jgi:hypothetical protein